MLISVAEARRELGDRRGAVQLVRDARELSAHAPTLGPKNLYRELGAAGRREAVARGRELGLL